MQNFPTVHSFLTKSHWVLASLTRPSPGTTQHSLRFRGRGCAIHWGFSERRWVLIHWLPRNMCVRTEDSASLSVPPSESRNAAHSIANGITAKKNATSYQVSGFTAAPGPGMAPKRGETALQTSTLPEESPLFTQLQEWPWGIPPLFSKEVYLPGRAESIFRTTQGNAAKESSPQRLGLGSVGWASPGQESGGPMWWPPHRLSGGAAEWATVWPRRHKHTDPVPP